MKKMLFSLLFLLLFVNYSNSEINHGTKLNLPFSNAVRVGDMLYLSGFVGANKDNNLIPGGIVPETKLAMQRIQIVLKRYGASLNNIASCQIILANINDWQRFNAIYVTYFKANSYPARTAFAANGLAIGAHVEIACTAVLGNLAKNISHDNLQTN